MTRKCLACRRGDCWDCARLVLQLAKCDHVCDDERQLGLFGIEEVQGGTVQAHRERDTDDGLMELHPSHGGERFGG